MYSPWLAYHKLVHKCLRNDRNVAKLTYLHCCGSGSLWKPGSGSASNKNPDPHPDTHKVVSWIWIRVNLKMISQNEWNLSLFAYFFQCLSWAFFWKIGSGSKSASNNNQGSNPHQIQIRIRIRIKSDKSDPDHKALPSMLLSTVILSLSLILYHEIWVNCLAGYIYQYCTSGFF